MNIETLERWMWLLEEERVDQLELEMHQTWLDEVRKVETPTSSPHRKSVQDFLDDTEERVP